MIPLQSLGERVVGWLWLAVFLLAPGVVAGVLWSPFLLSGRLRALFRRLPPAGSLVVTYPAVAALAGVPFVLGPLLALTRVPDDGAAMGHAVVSVVVPLVAVYVGGIPVLACEALPRLGVDWDPTGYGAGTWALLALGGAWYAATFAVPLYVFAVLAAFPA